MNKTININKARLMKVLKSPHISEKATSMAEKQRQFAFKVLLDADKIEIKQAVELLFEVKVDSVQTCRYQGKRKNFGRTRGKRAQWKKAYVVLKEGFDIVMGPE